MAIKHGRKAELWVANSGGTFENWHQYLNKIDHPATVDNPAFPLFGKDSVQRIVGLNDTKLSASGPRDVDLETLVYAAKNNLRAYKYYPAGSVASESCFAGTLLIAGVSSESDAESENKMNIDGEISGDVVRTTV